LPAIAALLLFLCLIYSDHAAALSNGDNTDVVPEQIIDIRFKGNETTRPQTMLQEVRISVGESFDTASTEKSRQAIMDLGLFKTVKVNTQTTPKGVIVEFVVEEKYYILPVPKINRSAEGDIKYGAELRWDNIRGINQRAKISWLRTVFADSGVNDRDKMELEYAYPRVLGTPYFFKMDYGRKDTQIEASDKNDLTGTYGEMILGASFDISRWHNTKGPSKGLRYGGGMLWSNTEYDYISGQQGLKEGSNIVSVRVGVSYTNIHDLSFYRRGSEYGYDLSVGARQLGSDEGFSTHSFYLRTYQPFFQFPHQNFNAQVRFGFSNSAGRSAFSMGGANSLRGFSRGSFSGNTMLLFNLEYLAPVWGYKPFRMLVFADVGAVAPALSEYRDSEIESGIGIGFRWKLRSFVKTDLRLDYAYGVSSEETKIYASTSETF